jgi:hypothetical protein
MNDDEDLYPVNDISSWNNIMSYFIFPDIRPLPLPSSKERIIELRVDEVLYKIISTGYFLLFKRKILIEKGIYYSFCFHLLI